MISHIRLFKIKRVGDATYGELKAIESYLTWLKLERKIDFEEYSPFKECHVRKELLSLYKTTYFSNIWDFERSAETVAELPCGNCAYEWILRNNPEMSLCGVYEITKREIENLTDDCSKMLFFVNINLENIEDLRDMVTESFLGFYDYVADYAYVLQKVLCMLKTVLKETDFDDEMILYEYVLK